MARGLRAALAAVVVAVAVVPAMAFGQLLRETPVAILVCAALPAAGWTVVVLACAGRGPWGARAAVFLWGAVVATRMATGANDALGAWVGGGWARTVVPVVVGPVVEEIAKGAALVVVFALWPGMLGVREGIACGALVGVGFAMTENLGYLMLAAVQGGAEGLQRGVWVRAVLGGFQHAAFSALTGAAIGWAWMVRRPGAAALGLGGAVALHMGWNGVGARAITDVLCNAERAGGACRAVPDAVGLYLTIPLLTLAGVAPAVVVLAVVVRRAMGSGSPPRRI
ncbi:MAG: PrsW family glutamic-type intramembrane protease [Candidatus Binatia bacterium]